MKMPVHVYAISCMWKWENIFIYILYTVTYFGNTSNGQQNKVVIHCRFFRYV